MALRWCYLVCKVFVSCNIW